MSVTIFACGDIVNRNANSGFIDDNIMAVIRKSDLAICNFEAPIALAGNEGIEKVGPHLSQKKESVELIKGAGFDLLSLANNHIYDYGHASFNATLDEIRNHQLEYIGAGRTFEEAYATKIFERKGLKIGVIAAAENEFGCLFEEQNRGGYAWINNYLIEDKIKELRGKVDLVLFIAHAGVENIDIPIPEWRRRYRRFCDLGVDAVIGHHPHVPHGIERYHNSIIFYSLGNFYFDYFKNRDNVDSYSILLTVTKNSSIHFEVVYHKMIGNKTCMSSQEDVSFSLKKLNSILENNYEQRIRELIIKLYRERYLPYYEQALGAPSSKLDTARKLKNILMKLLLRGNNSKHKGLLLLHNIRIDSHRFVMQRALSLLFEGNSKTNPTE